MNTETIKQKVTFNTKPDVLYALLLNEKVLSGLTGTKAKMSTAVNGKFDIFDGYCHGYNMELVEGKKIVQAWHFAEDGWPDDHFSICTFTLEKSDGRTKLEFVQTGVPDNNVESLKSGWKEFYWDPIKSYLKSGKS